MQITVVSVAVVDAIAEWEWNVLFFSTFSVSVCLCVPKGRFVSIIEMHSERWRNRG